MRRKLLLMMIFFVFPTNFAIITRQQTALSSEAVTMIMAGLDVVAFLFRFGQHGISKVCRRSNHNVLLDNAVNV